MEPLRHRDFRYYWAGFAVSRLGASIEEMGAVWLVYELTRSPVMLGLLGLARAVPAVILSPIAGVVADRVDQRRLLFTTQALLLLISVALGSLVLAGVVEVWHIYAQIAAHAAITAFDAAGRQALFPRLVPRSHLPEALTLTVTAARMSKVVGPVIAGLAIAGLGVASPFFLTAATAFGLMVAVLKMMPLEALTRLPGSSFRGELTEGLRYIVSTPVVRGLFTLEIAFGFLQMNPVMITLFSQEILQVGPEGLGGLLSAPAFGSLIGVFGLLALGQARRQGRFVILSALAYAVLLAAFSVGGGYVVALAVLATIGLFDAVVTVTRHSVVHLAVPNRMRGRVLGNMGLVTRGVTPLSEVQSGVLVGLFGPPLAVLTAALALLAAVGATVRANPGLWGFARDEQPDDSTAPRPI